MRILILVDCYYPSGKSSAKLVHDLAIELYRRGDHPVILTPSDEISSKAEVTEEEGVTVIRVKSGLIKGAHKVQRALREARLSRSLWRGAREYLTSNPCELIVFYSPTIFFGGLVRRLKRLWSCPAYLILRDIFPEWAADAGVLRRGVVYEYFRWVARRQYEASDVVAVQSPGNLEYFARSFPHKDLQLRVLFNWTAVQEERLPEANYRQALELQNKTVFLYGGNLGVAQDMDNVVRLAARFASRGDVHFLLVGDGSEVARVKHSIAKRGLDNIQIISGLGQREYLSMVAECDVGLISLDARLTTHNIPGKLLSYLYWGLPVLASVNPDNDLFEILATGGAGFCVANGDDDQLFSRATQLADNKGLREQIRVNARRLLETKFSAEGAVAQMYAHLKSVQTAAPLGQRLRGPAWPDASVGKRNGRDFSRFRPTEK